MNEFVIQLAAYHTALLGLTVLCLSVLIQNFLAGVIGLGKSDEVPGMPLTGQHQDSSFRILRTYANSCENLAQFGLIVLLAIVAGVTPSWVNWLVIIYVVLRLIYWVVYYSGTGQVKGGLRTIVYALGMFANLILAVLTFWYMLA